MYTGPIHIGIISFNRPDYLKRLVESLEANDLDNTVFWLFQDGAENVFNGTRYAKDKDVSKCVDIFNASSLPKKRVQHSIANVGIGINQFEAFETLTSVSNYCMVLECDQIVSPHFMRVMRVLAGQYLDNDFIFSVSPGHRKLCADGDVPKYLDAVKLTRGHWWCELFKASGWERIKPTFLKYYDLIDEVAYIDRPREDILNLFEKLGAGGFKTTGQDAAKGVACHVNGMGRIRPVVNRAINIGAKGWNFNETNDKVPDYIKQEPYIFEKDKDITKFKLLI